ncbi:GtrA family protein [Candidatus Methylospira mobilis]|uniref:GtrA family protein n=1 Tax=Candidatus Methylospira mobilis TaxID=1808979 RepID=A0A5Q0BHU6_9GAMM|nr:GtrA family protein [Candidatus Methylospira mobilis]QFY41396.1 GtrA family protein [Candidatus Methylospira mobilis]
MINIVGKQILRYALVGLFSNSAGYCVYLLITSLGFAPKATMSVLYLLAASIGYIGNRQWAFTHRGNPLASAVRYTSAHLMGYGINLSLLLVFTDRLNYPHQLVQAAAIPVVAVFLFVCFRYFVFPQNERKLDTDP